MFHKKKEGKEKNLSKQCKCKRKVIRTEHYRTIVIHHPVYVLDPDPAGSPGSPQDNQPQPLINLYSTCVL